MPNLDDLVPNPKNPRTITDKKIEMLRKSVKEYGSLDGFVYNLKTKRLISGHQWQKIFDRAKIVMLNKEYGYVEWNGQRWPYRQVSWSVEKEKAATIAANKGADEWDKGLLTEWFGGLRDLDWDLDLTMFDGEELAEYLPAETKKDLCDEDETPATQKTSIKLGDLFRLGSHRLLCGDSRDSANIERLMNGEKADMVFTDPPYGVNAVNKTGHVGVSGKTGWGKTSGEAYSAIYKKRTYRRIEGDDKPFEPGFLLEMSDKIVLWGANYYSDKLPQSDKWLVWDKKGEGIGADGNSFSDCELAWTNLSGRSVRIYRHLWSGLLREGNRKDELKERVHPTQKPVGLCEQVLNEFDPKSVLDLFLGSGSTLIACEKTNRKCYGMEIDPQYCQVIIDRYEKFTGKKAVLQELNRNEKKTAKRSRAI